ncbi:TLC domain-containing protein At5g14285-like isoform X1 [Humulus lupulus]|uniref:TLC domain-containing protein At5g14285-like isoform X1 n=1 Tax=Humulus lupulus TaxID=3486 RepID=UPI002B410CEC|nr:TLC domain-containing protein At5g14285-like isoform X1 [Humulus lupulus]
METLNLFTPTLATFFTIFLLIYAVAYFVLCRNWGPKNIAEATSCVISLAHGTPSVLLALNALTKSHMPLSSFASPNTNSQNIVLDYSIAYFSVDLLHYLVFFPTDILFISHHLATLYVFMTCRFVVHHGASALLVLLVLAEATSPCQNVWSLAYLKKAGAPAALKLYKFLSPRFYAFYTVFRVVLGPLFVLKMVVFYLSGAADSSTPKWAWISWMVVITTAIFVSILWVLNHWIEWFRERRVVQKKVK